MTQDITNTPAIHSHNGLEYHVDESGWCKVYDPEEPDVWREKGPAAELLPAALLPKQDEEDDELRLQEQEDLRMDEVLHCTECGRPIYEEDAGFFCSDECREECSTL